MNSIDQHYESHLQADRIIEQLQAAYPDGPTVFQLAPVDQLHIGGIKASLKLIEQIQRLGAKRILDVGSGLGGLQRLIQQQTTAEVIGVDLSHGLNAINCRLSGLNDQRSAVVTADAQRLPFAAQQFDLIIFQHSLLNIPDCAKTLRECKRRLTNNGHLLLHEVILGDHPEQMQYPVPWARKPEHSHLVSSKQLQQHLTTAGFKLLSLNNWSEEALAWRQRQSQKERYKVTETVVVSPTLILGPEFREMGKNVIQNLKTEAAQVVEILASHHG